MGRRCAPRKNNLGGDEEMDATELARGNESLQAHLHRQALSLRLSEEDRCALQFLIESLNDDGYLEESLESLAAGLAPDDVEQQEELVHRFTMALRLAAPPGAGGRRRPLPGRMPVVAAEGDAGRRRCAAGLRHGAAHLRASRWSCWPGVT